MFDRIIQDFHFFGVKAKSFLLPLHLILLKPALATSGVLIANQKSKAQVSINGSDSHQVD